MNVSGSVSANFETPLAKMVQLKVQNKLRIKMVILLYTDKNGNTTVNF